MLNYQLRILPDESTFAEQHHNVVYAFLRSRGLPIDEFYDIAIFGYLRAVRKYLARPELQQYSFTTIAYRAMSGDVYHSYEYRRRAKRYGDVCQLNEDRHASELRDEVSERVDNIVDFETLARSITPTQRRIASLRADGYRDKEIAAMCGIARADVAAEMEDAKCRILMFRENDAAMAA